MMFEVQDLAVASPATVSRCGMVYLEPRNIGLQPFINCWLKRLPESIEPYKEMLNNLFAGFLEVKFLRCIFSYIGNPILCTCPHFLDTFFVYLFP